MNDDRRPDSNPPGSPPGPGPAQQGGAAAGRIDPSRVMETLVLNARKGERYRVKLAGDPAVLVGIPLARPGDTTLDADAFRMEVASPADRAGIVHGRIRDIDWIERAR